MPKSNLKALFCEQGFSSCKAELWAEFVRQVLEIYWQASDRLLTPKYWDSFKKKRGALGAPKKRCVKKVIRNPIEDAITSEIGSIADDLYSQLASDHFLRKHDVQFRFEFLIHSETRAGRYSKKVDFKVWSAVHGGPELAIEAKPLISEVDIDGRYLAEEGIGCFFTNDSPYTKGPLGAMLAYTICDNKTSKKKNILDGLLKFQPAPDKIVRVTINGTDQVDCSYHDRSSWGLIPITILHLERLFPAEVHIDV